MTGLRIPFNKPSLAGDEIQYISEAIERGQLSGDGLFTRRCAEMLEQALAAQRVLLTPSCTHALEMCGLLLGIGPGDEVIVPSFAFVTTAGAFANRGARPVFVDVRRDTFNLDEEKLTERITTRTKAIVALHYAGVGCEMDRILAIAEATGIPVVEDNAHGLFGTYRGRHLGTLGSLATQSFHETKNFTCGEGGALLVNRSDLAERAEILRQKGTDRNRFLRGEVQKYTWVDFGSNYVLSELQAAFLYGQLEARERIQSERARIWNRYFEGLEGWASTSGVELPQPPEHCSHPFHMFHILLPSADSRARLIESLRQRGILAVFHFLPLHLSRMGRRFGGRLGDCPVSESISDRILRLPFFNGMKEAEQDEVVAAVLDFDGV